ncbi:MAG: tetratricopeptide repeat protein [Candidatus Riflebacteria bacterium]|nr:tetratricopeptide repeat protein [Candidatus Riflebacteria bacterium]
MDSARDLFQRGIDLQERGLFDQAVDAYARALELEPDNEDVLLNLGAAWLQKGVAQKAVELLSRVLTRNPDHALALFNIGKAYLFLDDLPKALAAFERTEEFLPDDPEVRKSRAQVLSRLGRQNEAADLLMSRLEALGTDPEALHALGADLLELERWQDGSEVFRRCLNAVPDSIPALEGLIRCQLALGHLDKASTSVKRALMMAPSHPAFHVQMVDLHLAENHVEAALDHLKKALQRSPDDPVLRAKMDELMRRLPVLQKRAGEPAVGGPRPSPVETQVYDVLDALYDSRITFPMAIHELRDLYARDDNDLFVCDELANLLFQARQFGEAAQLYTRLYGARPLDPRHRINLAKATALDGDPQGARQFLLDSMHELPGEPDLPLTLVEIKLLEKNFQGALQTVVQTLADFPDHPHGLFLQGYVAIRLDDLVQAERAFQKLLPLAPNDEEVAVWYGRLAILRGKPQEGLAVWARLHDGMESLVEILARVELSLAAGRPAEVMPLLKRIGDYKPRFLEDHLLFGKAFFYGGDFAGAQAQLDVVLKEEPEHGEAQALTALCHLGRGKPNKFWICWQKAVESDALQAVLLGLVLAPVLQFAQAERIRVETRKLLEIAVADEADRARLTRLLHAYAG